MTGEDPAGAKVLNEMVIAVSTEMYPNGSDADVYKEVAKRLAGLVAEGMADSAQLRECDMCGKMAIPFTQPPEAN